MGDLRIVASTLPVSEEYGPLVRDEGVWNCYAHSPTGAVYAGLGLLALVHCRR